MMQKCNIKSGDRFGKLIIIKNAPKRSNVTRWYCICDCGTKVDVTQCGLRDGSRIDCGCETTQRRRKAATKHGATQSSEYKVWSAMKDRCKRNPIYIKRGIKVCKEWEEFEVFLQYLKGHNMYPHPGKGWSLDRIDNNKGYEPGNIRWATYREQENNKSDNRKITIENTTYTVSEWERKKNFKPSTISVRLDMLGWDPTKAVVTPVRKYNKSIT